MHMCISRIYRRENEDKQYQEAEQVWVICGVAPFLFYGQLKCMQQ